MKSAPVFAILGHPNEGKSTLVSTLTEDDTVRVSPFPGETTACRTYTVEHEGVPLIQFVDTPGFQSPRKTLAWFKAYDGPAETILEAFLNAHENGDGFSDERELFEPVSKGAGIIYVADGSRPVRANDLAEMEILRLTGLPRMAVINCKSSKEAHLPAWRAEFRKTFNAVRVFNAHSASAADRQELLSALMTVDPEWAPALKNVVSIFSQEWEHRIHRSASAMANLLKFALTHQVSKTLRDEAKKTELTAKLTETFKKEIQKKEMETRATIRRIFKHTLFDVDLPQDSILAQDLFDSRTMKLLGLTRGQLTTAAATCGAAAGVAIDLAAVGQSFGLFALGGAIGGAASVLLGQKQLAKATISGVPLGGHEITLGPCRNLQVLFVLLDRIHLYFRLITSRAHGKRDELALTVETRALQEGGLSQSLSSQEKKAFHTLFEVASKKESEGLQAALAQVESILREKLSG